MRGGLFLILTPMGGAYERGGFIDRGFIELLRYSSLCNIDTALKYVASNMIQEKRVS